MTSITPRQFILEWIETLRTGMYKRGRMHLHSIDEDNRDCYCPLGVACEIGVKYGMVVMGTSPSIHQIFWYASVHARDRFSEQNYGSLPFQLSRFLDCQIPEKDIIVLNDVDNMSHSQVADWIEKRVLPLFPEEE